MECNPTNNNNTEHDHEKWSPMVSILFTAQEDDSKKCGDNHNNSSHHLVDRCGALSKCNEHEWWTAEITSGWDGKEKRVNVGAHFLLNGLGSTWWERDLLTFWFFATIVKSFAYEETHADKFTQEHDCGLQIWVSK